MIVLRFLRCLTTNRPTTCHQRWTGRTSEFLVTTRFKMKFLLLRPVLNLNLIIAFVRRTPHRCPAFTDNVKQIHYRLEMHWRKSFILNLRSTANVNAITEHTDTALCKKLKTTHPHGIVELNNYEKASVDDKNLMCLVTFSQDTNSKQDEISERPRAPCDGTNKNPLQCDICQ